MRKVNLAIFFITSLIILAPFPAFANRGMINIGPKEVSIQESAQKAIVAWNCQEEVIILSADVWSTEPTLVLEVLPLPLKPEKVEAGAFDSFKKLTTKVNEEIRAIRAKGIPGRGSGDAERLSDKESFYTKALKLWPEYAQAHNNLGDVYEKQGQYQAAIKEYRIASALAPNVSFPYLGIGDAYFKLAEFHQAIVYYEKGLAIDPNDKLSKGRLRLSRILTTKILFPFDSCQLTDEAVEQLKVIAEALSSPEFEETVNFIIAKENNRAAPQDLALEMLEPYDGKLSSTVLRGLGAGNCPPG